MLKLDALAAGFVGSPLIEGLSLELAAGERIALSGPSGCGKSTLLRAIAGLIDPLGGRVLLDGETPAKWGWPRFRRRVVLAEQQPVFPDLSVGASLARPFHYRTADRAYPESEALELLDLLGLERAVYRQRARELSVGQQQRVSLARALLVRPRVTLLDEPTSALDPEAARAVEALIVRQCEREGLAAIVVSHDAAQASRWCTAHLDLAPCLAQRGPGPGEHAA